MILSCQCCPTHRYSTTTQSHRRAASKVQFLLMDRVNYLSNRTKLKLIYTKYHVILKDAILFTLTALAAKLQLPQMEQINSAAFLLSECHSLMLALQSKDFKYQK